MAAMRRMIAGSLAVTLLMLGALTISPARAADQRECRDDDRGVSCERAQKRREIRPEERLSPEERRQLRRDIKDAGREIYPAR